jgi:hypothetical protein
MGFDESLNDLDVINSNNVVSFDNQGLLGLRKLSPEQYRSRTCMPKKIHKSWTRAFHYGTSRNEKRPKARVNVLVPPHHPDGRPW